MLVNVDGAYGDARGVRAGSRHVRIAIDQGGRSIQLRIPLEAGLVPRYYLPVAYVGSRLLRPSQTMSQWLSKSTATCWSVQVREAEPRELASMYRTAASEAQQVAGLIACYQERVDVKLDGEPQQRPRTPFVSGRR